MYNNSVKFINSHQNFIVHGCDIVSLKLCGVNIGYFSFNKEIALNLP